MITVTEADFVRDMILEVHQAREKFPPPNPNLAALTEEVGELARAVLSEGHPRIYREAVQVAAMALRVAMEGDPTVKGAR